MRKMWLCAALLGQVFAQSSSLSLPTAPPTSSMGINLMSENGVLPLISGEVLILGNQFPGRAVQGVILRKLRQKEITVRVLTSAVNIAFYAPLIRAGGSLKVFAGTLSGSSVAVMGGSGTVVIPNNGQYQVVSGPNVAAALKTQFEQAWRYAR